MSLNLVDKVCKALTDVYLEDQGLQLSEKKPRIGVENNAIATTHKPSILRSVLGAVANVYCEEHGLEMVHKSPAEA